MKSVCLGVCACAVLAVVLPLGVAGEEPAPEKPPAGQAGGGLEKAPELLLWQEIPTVISASRHEEPASRAPNAVSIITREQIHASGMMSLGDLLRLAVGVDVGQIDAWNYAIGVRGLHGRWSNNTLVLMDGRSIYDPMFGGVMWGTQPVLLEDIERIEVVRGPGGAAWGANAANGVINIITKKPGETPGGFLSQTLTSRLDSLTYMRYGLTAGKLDLRLSAGYDSMPEIGVREGPGNHDFLRLPRANLRSTYHFDEERSLDIDAGYVDGVLGNVEGPPGTFAGARWFPQSHYLRTRFTHQKAPDDLWYVQYFLNRDTLDLSQGGPWIRYTQHDVEVQRVQPAGDRHVLTYGGNLRLDYLDNHGPSVLTGPAVIQFDNRSTRNVQTGLFVQDHIRLNDQWSVVAGARADRNSYTGWEWAGRGSLLYHPVQEHTFRVSAARAF
ncbi:MAG TPA: TonB-dependent receptor, partial [Phycisphaerae bacterium]|nr:TonB-dependent receptor [Phycisphaerae bacterium]